MGLRGARGKPSVGYKCGTGTPPEVGRWSDPPLAASQEVFLTVTGRFSWWLHGRSPYTARRGDSSRGPAQTRGRRGGLSLLPLGLSLSMSPLLNLMSLQAQEKRCGRLLLVCERGVPHRVPQRPEPLSRYAHAVGVSQSGCAPALDRTVLEGMCPYLEGVQVGSGWWWGWLLEGRFSTCVPGKFL